MSKMPDTSKIPIPESELDPRVYDAKQAFMCSCFTEVHFPVEQQKDVFKCPACGLNLPMEAFYFLDFLSSETGKLRAHFKLDRNKYYHLQTQRQNATIERLKRGF